MKKKKKKKKKKDNPASYEEMVEKINTIRFSAGKTPPGGALKKFLDFFAETFLPYFDRQLDSRISKKSFWIGITILGALITLLTLIPLILKYLS